MGDKSIVDILKEENPPNKQCNEMFRVWLENDPSSSWESLISTLKEIGLEKVAEDILKDYNGTLSVRTTFNTGFVYYVTL